MIHESNGTFAGKDLKRYPVYKVTDIVKDVFDLNKTLRCGQCFRWLYLTKDSWIGESKGRVLLIRQMVFLDNKPGLLVTAPQEEWEQFWLPYFSLDLDYDVCLDKNNLDPFAIESYRIGQGIKLLRQDAWESLISYITSQRNNIPGIQTTLRKLCSLYPHNAITPYGYELFTFPTPEDILAGGIELLREAGLGYRAPYAFEAAEAVKAGHIDFEYLQKPQVSCSKVIEVLSRLNGVGPKVANCVALFGLEKWDAFPIDLWMERIMDKYYPRGFELERYGAYAGIIQQYMFYNVRGRDL